MINIIINNKDNFNKCFVAISIVVIITALQLSSTVFSGLSSSSPSSSSSSPFPHPKATSANVDGTGGTDKTTTTLLKAVPNNEIIPSAVAQEGEGDFEVGDGVSSGDDGSAVDQGADGGEGGEGGEDEGLTPSEDMTEGGAELVEPESVEKNCNNSIDDDGDRLTDLADTQDCPTTPPHSPSPPSPSPSARSNISSGNRSAQEEVPFQLDFVPPQALQQQEEFCGDNIDNNGNGQTDEGCVTDLNTTRSLAINDTGTNIECIPKADRSNITKIRPSALWTSDGFFTHISTHNCLPPEKGQAVKGGPVRTAIVVTTVVFNDDGRTNRPSDFTFTVYNNNRPMTPRQGQGPPGINIPVQQGDVAISRPSYAYYTSAISQGCLSPIRNGQILHCTIYYDDKGGAPSTSKTSGNVVLVITKRFVGSRDPVSNTESLVKVFTYANPRSPPCSALNIRGCVDAPPFREFRGLVHPGRVLNIPPGMYVVSEETIPNYQTQYSSDCYAHSHEPVMSGQIKYCTIFNIYTEGFGAGRLTVANIVFNDNGGTKHPSDFRFSLSTSNNQNIDVSIPASSNRRIASLTTPQEIGQVTRSILNGGYQVTQLQDPRYFTTLSPDCHGGIDSGQTKRCTIYNDDKPLNSVAGRRAPPPQPPGTASVKVITRIVNDNGGTATLENFKTIICGGAPLNRDLRIHGIAIPRLRPCPQGENAGFQYIALLFSEAGSDARGPPGKVIYLQPGSSYVVFGLGPIFSGSAPRQQYETSSECRGTAQLNQAQVCVIVHDDKPR